MILQNEINNFLKHLRANGKSPLTVKNYGFDLTGFLRYAGPGTDIKSIALDDVNGFVIRLKDQGKAKTTINRAKSSLATFFQYVVDAGRLPNRPFRELKHDKIVRRPPRMLGPEERLPLYKWAFHRKDVWLLLHLYLRLGLRLSEALGLDVVDVEGQSELRVVGKRDKVRTLPIRKAVRAAIRVWLKVREQLLYRSLSNAKRTHRKTKVDQDALFITSKGRRLSTRGAQFLLTNLFKKAGLDRMSPHKLRHAFATKLASEGTNLRVLQDLLGHDSLSTVQIYTHVTRDDLKQALDREGEKEESLI